MKLSQLVESFVISNDEFEDYLNRATEQLTQELQTGKNSRDTVHDLALTFADQHNKSYDAYTRMSDSLASRMHTLGLAGSTSTDVAPMGMDAPMGDMGMDEPMGDMGMDEPMGDDAEMMTDPMGDMEMDVPAEDEMPGDSDMEDYAAVMGNEPELEESMNEALETETVKTKVGERPRGPGWTLKRSGEQRNEPTDTWERKFKRVGKPTGLGESDADEKARQRAFAKADEPERGEKAKKVSVKKAPWEESVNEAEADEDTVRELVLYADNDGQLYQQSTSPIRKNLSKKFAKGVYDHDKAIVLWKYHADRAAKKYGIEHGNNDGFRIFSPADRKEAAKQFADEWQMELDAGNMEETVTTNEAGGHYTKPVYDMIEQHGIEKVMHELLTALDADVIQDALGRMGEGLGESVSEAEDTTEYGIVRYPDTAISYIKKTANGWEHIFDKSYGFKGPVEKADMKHAKKIKTDKVPSRLREFAPVIGAVAGGVARAAASAVGGVAKAAMSKGIKGAATRAGISAATRKESVESRASRMVSKAFTEAKKPVSQMTPAEKKADANRRKEYNEYQKSKRTEKSVKEAKKPDANGNGIPDYAEDGKGKNDTAKGKKTSGKKEMTDKQKKFFSKKK